MNNIFKIENYFPSLYKQLTTPFNDFAERANDEPRQGSTTHITKSNVVKNVRIYLLQLLCYRTIK